MYVGKNAIWCTYARTHALHSRCIVDRLDPCCKRRKENRRFTLSLSPSFKVKHSATHRSVDYSSFSSSYAEVSFSWQTRLCIDPSLSLCSFSLAEEKKSERKNGHTVTCLVYRVFAHIRTTFYHLRHYCQLCDLPDANRWLIQLF